jgi:hypothetical protein
VITQAIEGVYLTRQKPQWRITGTDPHGKPIEIHHHGMEVMRRLPNGEWVFFIDHP